MDSSLPAEIQDSLSSLDRSLCYKNNDWDTLVGLARNVINSLQMTSFFNNPKQREQKVYTIEVLQRLAYYDLDAGGVADVAEWCLDRWLQMHETYPEDVAVSKGISYQYVLI